ncbi:hypothetical protein ACHAWT_010488 [Skeletonema menzelii]
MMRRLASRKSDPLFISNNSGSGGNIANASSNLPTNNNTITTSSPRRSIIIGSISNSNTNSTNTTNDDEDSTAKRSRHPSSSSSWCCRKVRTLLVLPSDNNRLSSLLHTAQTLFHQFKCYLERIDPIYAAAICIFLFVTICTLLILELSLLIGPRGSIKGGAIGKLIDQYFKDYTKYQTMNKWKRQLNYELHLPIVYKEQQDYGALVDQRWYPLGDSLSSRPNVVIVEMLLREKRRKDRLGKMIHDAVMDYRDGCFVQNKMIHDAVVMDGDTTSEQQQLPMVVLQLQTNDGQMTRLLPYWLTSVSALNELETVTVDYSDINPHPNAYLSEQLLQLERNYYSKEPITTRSSSIPQSIRNCPNFIANQKDHYYATRTDPTLHCLGYFLGGMQLGDDHHILQLARYHITNIFTTSLYTHHHHAAKKSASSSSCNSKVGYAVLSQTPTPEDQVRKSSSIWNHVSTIFATFPPNHPAYLCLPPLHPNKKQVGISPYNTANEELSFQSTFVNKLLTAYESKRLEGAKSDESIIWGVATLPCEFDDFHDGGAHHSASCCNQVSVAMLDTIEGESVEHYLKKNAARKDKPTHHLFFTFVNVPELEHSSKVEPFSTQEVSVSISENTSPLKSKRMQALRYKESIQKKMRHKSWTCEPGWWCNRCLQASVYGSFSKCSFVCGKCASKFICNGREKETQIDINVQVTGMNLPQTKSVPAVHHQQQQQRIPRIIHQTYFEDITKETFPQLVRLQNTWKASGWEYRFYSDDTARNYIRTHYPERFVSVFDTLLPGAYKADFFRYLVLFKEGGIYADIDVMLDSNLDQFITPDLAFFAPIDTVGVYADESFCLWNGLIGSAPAHPALANAIEWMVNLVSSRGDLYDVERAVCEVTGIDKIENWKIRAEPGLILSGPCALGPAVNNALGKETLSKFVPGLMRLSSTTSANGKVQRESDDVIGDVMILVADKTDLGSFRFSDPERNILFASTDMPGLSKTPLVYENQGGTRNIKKKKKKLLPHYSVTNDGDALWGTHDVYADNLASSERVRIEVHYE